MPYTVALDAFHGPLDLLLYLVKQARGGRPRHSHRHHRRPVPRPTSTASRSSTSSWPATSSSWPRRSWRSRAGCSCRPTPKRPRTKQADPRRELVQAAARIPQVQGRGRGAGRAGRGSRARACRGRSRPSRPAPGACRECGRSNSGTWSAPSPGSCARRRRCSRPRSRWTTRRSTSTKRGSRTACRRRGAGPLPRRLHAAVLQGAADRHLPGDPGTGPPPRHRAGPARWRGWGDLAREGGGAAATRGNGASRQQQLTDRPN